MFYYTIKWKINFIPEQEFNEHNIQIGLLAIILILSVWY